MHARLRRPTVELFSIPTERPESDGTMAWDATEVVLAEVHADRSVGLGYTYGSPAVAAVVHGKLAAEIEGRDAMDIPGCWEAMRRAIRNLGRPGICSMAMAAVDLALWDLKAKLLNLPLAKLLGLVRDHVPIYGSGGFTSYSIAELQEQLGGWAEQGIAAVKMKVGREPVHDFERVRAARAAIGPDIALYVDANGAYSRQQARRFAEQFAAEGVTWFEEPVSSDDLEGLHWLRDRVPAGMEIAAGEYGYELAYFQHMLAAEAVHVQQADITRCAGPSEFARVDSQCAAYQTPLSAHTAPSAHLHPCCALERVRNIEYFHDHARIESMLFDGASQPRQGALWPDLSRPGIGLDLKTRDARRYAA
ncbi:MAG: mandelate racemase [Acidobacteria bacterium]|nr:MAG: mandelate racemase [Acidobacteriota bacterium]